ncbi:MAG TPA: M20 aminoacylase family protein [Polyangiales bacterium]|nr:M20 aminoacylase family protein [Polyangiales bacterium]
MTLIDSIVADAAQIQKVRRELHAHPELGFQEARTSDLIAKQLTDWGIPIHRGLGKTGVVGILRNGSSTRAVGLRADMDALPMTELNSFTHKSTNQGRMHACGHDGHMAMLLSAAKYMSQHRNFDGTVYLIFQPAEEGQAGARAMIRDGLFERFPMQAIFGAHNWPGLAAGQFAIKSGPSFASSNEFKITLHGKGGHGAMPHLGVDPVIGACQMVQAFQSIVSRNVRPIDAAVISVTMLNAGEFTSVIPNTCALQGTVRTFRAEVLDLVEQRMRTVANATAAAFDARCDFEFKRNYPPLINHVAETEFARGVMRELVGDSNVHEFEATMGAEDFAYFLQAIPGAYFLIGNGEGEHRPSGHAEGPCNLHNASYDFNDNLIPIGGSLWVRLAERFLAAS